VHGGLLVGSGYQKVIIDVDCTVDLVVYGTKEGK